MIYLLNQYQLFNKSIDLLIIIYNRNWGLIYIKYAHE